MGDEILGLVITFSFLLVVVGYGIQIYITDKRSKDNEKKLDRLIVREELKSEQEKRKD